MTHRTDFRAIGVGARGKRTVVRVGENEWGEAVKAFRDEHGVVAVSADGSARRLGEGDELHVHDEASGARRRYDHNGTEVG